MESILEVITFNTCEYKGKGIAVTCHADRAKGAQEYILILIYLSTTIGLTPGGSTNLHAIHRTSQLTTKQHE
jgi:hypothetical protein